VHASTSVDFSGVQFLPGGPAFCGGARIFGLNCADLRTGFIDSRGQETITISPRGFCTDHEHLSSAKVRQEVCTVQDRTFFPTFQLIFLFAIFYERQYSIDNLCFYERQKVDGVLHTPLNARGLAYARVLVADIISELSFIKFLYVSAFFFSSQALT